AGIQMFPDGNAGMIRLLVKTLIPSSIDGERSMEGVWKNPVNFAALDQPGQQTRLRLDSTVVRVEHAGEAHKSEFVWVTYNSGGQLYRVKAKNGVMAGGVWMTKDVVRELDGAHREVYWTFNETPLW